MFVDIPKNININNGIMTGIDNGKEKYNTIRTGITPIIALFIKWKVLADAQPKVNCFNFLIVKPSIRNATKNGINKGIQNKTVCAL